MRTVVYVQISSGMGGSVHSLLLLAERISHYGYRPVIVGQQDREGLWEQAERLGLPYYPLYLTSWAKSDFGLKDLLYLPVRVNAVRKLVAICQKENAALVHTNLELTLDGAIAARLAGIPHIMHVRSEFGDPRMKTWFGGVRTAARIMATTSERVVAISEACAAPFRRTGVNRNVVVIPNAVRPPLEIPTDEMNAKARRSLAFDPTAPVITLVGQVIDRKGHGEFVEAARYVNREFPNARFLIVGDGSPDYVERLKRQAGRLYSESVVRFLGYVQDPWPVYFASDIIACPSWVEGFGRVAVEGMLAGKPIVGTSVGGLVDIIEDGVTGYVVPPLSPDHIADRVLKLLADGNLRYRMGKTGQEKALHRYAPEVHARRIAEVYDSILNG